MKASCGSPAVCLSDSREILGSPPTVHVKVAPAVCDWLSRALAWTVGGQPKISRLTLRQTAGQPRLAFTVTAGQNAPDLRTLQITVPHALIVGTGRGVAVTSTARRPAHLRFSAHATHQTVLTIKLRKVTRSVRITLGAPSLRARGGKVPNSTLHRRQVVTVNVVDAAARRTRLSEKVAITGR